MNFSSYLIKNPVAAVWLFARLALVGLLAFKSMGVQDFPDIELPVATLDGEAPAQLATHVARKIEAVIASLQSVKNITTKVLNGQAQVTVEFVLKKPISDAVTDVRDAVTSIKADLPGELQDPQVTKVSTAGRPVLTFAVTSALNADGKAPRLDALAVSSTKAIHGHAMGLPVRWSLWPRCWPCAQTSYRPPRFCKQRIRAAIWTTSR